MLVELGPEVLADALVNLAAGFQEADDLIEQLIATPDENVERFKRKLSGLKASGRFVDWRSSASFARELQMILQDLKAGVDDPLIGAELVAAFYEADSLIFGMCDDSSGAIGDVFRWDARTLFMDFATCCSDKEKVAELILKLNREDGYGVRDSLLDCAGTCLPEGVVRTMIDTLWNRANNEDNEYQKRHNLRLVESLARQVRDAELFEKARIASGGALSTSACIDIAREYLKSGDVQTAQIWLGKMPQGENFHKAERDKLFEEVYRQLGDTASLSELLYEKLQSHRSTENLNAFLEVIGHEKREDVLADQVRQILGSPSLLVSDAEFLIEMGKIDEAEDYLIKRNNFLNGSDYDSLSDLAKAMESDRRYLVASLIYRSLLVSLLERGYAKAYSHGVRYLRKLDTLSARVLDWKSFDRHNTFKKQIAATHGRKRSFWSKYESGK
jgi:hypothetical protein